MLKDISFISAPSGITPEATAPYGLGALLYSHSTAENAGGAALSSVRMNVPMRCLDSQEWAGELFVADKPVEQGRHGNIHYCHDGSILFGAITIDENRFADTPVPPLQAATQSAYLEIFELLNSLDYPSVFRFWNYMAGINQLTHGLERYRQFNYGRQEAFSLQGNLPKESIPAACALGFAEGPLSIAFLAGKSRVAAVENPRQVSAYDYPKQYGPRSPLFSRASLADHESGQILFLSGTASIQGHETLHAGDVARQTRESMLNIQAVLSEANRKSVEDRYSLSRMFYTVYVRHAEDFNVVANELRHAIGGEPHAIYLHADICRQDLLVEIEGVSHIPA